MFILVRIVCCLIAFAKEKGLVPSEVFENAVSATEEGFLQLVSETFGSKPTIAAVGSCCLAGFISEGTLCIANMGDSRAVLGSVKKRPVRRQMKIVAQQITEDHNACVQKVRQELKSDHPDDPEIVVKVQGVWRIKGIIQVLVFDPLIYIVNRGENLNPLNYKFLYFGHIQRVKWGIFGNLSKSETGRLG